MVNSVHWRDSELAPAMGDDVLHHSQFKFNNLWSPVKSGINLNPSILARSAVFFVPESAHTTNEMLTHSTYFIPFYQLNEADKYKVDVPPNHGMDNDIESEGKSFDKGINSCKRVKPLFWGRLIPWLSVRSVLVKFIELILYILELG